MRRRPNIAVWRQPSKVSLARALHHKLRRAESSHKLCMSPRVCVVRPPPGDSFWYKELVESLPDVVLKSKRGDAGADVGTYNARACGIKLLKSARKVELVRLMRAAEVRAAAGTNHPSVPTF